MNTLWMLQGRYKFQPIIPIETVARDIFELEPRVFLRKIDNGEIQLPVVRMEKSQKSAKGIYVEHLAEHIDDRVADAKRDYDRIFN